MNNFYFLILDYLESWLNIMVVSMFSLDKHDWASLQGLTLSVSTSLSTGSKYFESGSKPIISELRKSSTSLSYTKLSTEKNSKGYY